MLSALLLTAVLAALVATGVGFGESTRNSPCALRFELQSIPSLFHTEEPHFTPELSPAVAHDPVLLAVRLGAPAYDTDNVVHRSSAVGHDAARVLEDGIGVNTTADWAAGQDLLLHVGSSADGTVLGDGSVGVLVQSSTTATIFGECGASTGYVLCFAAPVGVGAETLFAFTRAGHVRLGSFVADTGARPLGDGTNPLVRGDHGSAVASVARTDAVEHVLNREVDVDACSITSDLDAVTQCRDGTVGPASSTVLRDVLVAVHGAVVYTILVAPVQICWDSQSHVVLGTRAVVIIADDTFSVLAFR